VSGDQGAFPAVRRRWCSPAVAMRAANVPFGRRWTSVAGSPSIIRLDPSGAE
jgi:hypothetical protein